MTVSVGAVIHENDNYEVVVTDNAIVVNGITYPHVYEVKNKATGVMEYITPAMPDALYTAEHINHALLSKAWEWREETKEGVRLPKGIVDLLN